jgi:TonB family protein
MLRLNALLASFLILPASFLSSQSGTIRVPETALRNSPSAVAELNPASLVLELDRAILVLNKGLKENWKTRDQYITAFERTPSTDSAGSLVTEAKKYVECTISAHLRIHQIWDEGPTIGVEAHQAITEFTKKRDEADRARIVQAQASSPEGKTAELHLLPCAVAGPRTVAISAGVAVGMLKTKIDPVYPAEALKKHVSGTVVLGATISAEGLVESLRVISGPASLQQAALDAVRRWSYRSYLLNDTPVEFETTVNVVFVQSN